MSMTATPDMPRPSLILRWLAGLWSLALGSFLCISPITSVLVLGWLQGRARAHAFEVAGAADLRPGWVLGARGRGWIVRLLGGLATNIRRGTAALCSLFLMTVPFTGLWLTSWWAGWENSFNKGYEQSFVGPLVGLSGVAICLVVLAFLPLALAHQASEDRAFSAFELRRVRNVLTHTGWGYPVFVATMVLAALPLFAGRGLMVFIEQIVPGSAMFSMDEKAELMGQIAALKAIYVFLSLVLLRRWAAGIYARAALRAVAQDRTDLWAGSAMQELAHPNDGSTLKPSVALVRWVRFTLVLALWFGLVAQIYVGQFLNHDWVLWISHPYFLLPWAG